MPKVSTKEKELDPNSLAAQRVTLIEENERVLKQPLEQITRLKETQREAVSMEMLDYERYLRRGLELLELARPTNENPEGDEELIQEFFALAPQINSYRDYVDAQMRELNKHHTSATPLPEYLPSGATDKAFFVDPDEQQHLH